MSKEITEGNIIIITKLPDEILMDIFYGKNLY